MEITECPQCGAPAQPSARACEYCKAEFFVTSLAYLGRFKGGEVAKYLKHYKELAKQDPENEEGQLGLGLCYLQTGLHELAEQCFAKIIDAAPDQAQAYYYCALARIRGRRIRSLKLNEVRQLEAYLSTALQLADDVPQYMLLLAMLKRDYYEANGMRVPPPGAGQLLAAIGGASVDRNELVRLMECAQVANPELYLNNITVVGE